jgi:hypothetical protein
MSSSATISTLGTRGVKTLIDDHGTARTSALDASTSGSSLSISSIRLPADISTALFERGLDYLYSAEGADEGVAVLFDGFDSVTHNVKPLGCPSSLERLREVGPTIYVSQEPRLLMLFSGSSVHVASTSIFRL